MENFYKFAAIFTGGGAGSILRYLAGILIDFKTFPPATLVVNIVGSLLIGITIGLAEKYNLSQYLILFLKIGLCGGFTTFSSFSAENLSLIESGKIYLAIIYIILSVISSITAVYLGKTII